jgi:TolA-binding protein
MPPTRRNFQQIRIRSDQLNRWLDALDLQELKLQELQLLRQELNQVIESIDHQEQKHTAAAAAGGPAVDPIWLKKVGVKRRVSRLALTFIEQQLKDRAHQAAAAAERKLAQVLLRHGLPSDPDQLDIYLNNHPSHGIDRPAPPNPYVWKLPQPGIPDAPPARFPDPDPLSGWRAS